MEWMAELILYAADLFPELKKIYGDFASAEHSITVEARYPLPEDEAEERALDLQEVGTARSIKSYLMKWGGADHNGMPEDDAEAEIEQIAKEKQMLEDSFAAEFPPDSGGDE